MPSQLLHEPVDGLRVHRFAVNQRAAPAPGSAGAGEGGDEHDLGLSSIAEFRAGDAGNSWRMVDLT